MSNLLPSQRTSFKETEKDWILIDAREQVLGRLAGRIAHRLRGKHKPTYAPHLNVGDHVVVVNVSQLVVSGNKLDQKKYYQHSGFVGGMKTFTLRERMENDPVYVLKKAVKRMLPSGPMGRKLMGQLHIYANAEHPHKAQKPAVWEPTFK